MARLALNRFWLTLALALFLGLFAVGCAGEASPAAEVAAAATESPAAKVPAPTIEGLPPEFQRLAEVWDLLSREHIDGENLDAKQLSDGAIRGMLQALDDPYAAYLRPDQFAVESQDIQGFFEGIGAEVGMRDGRITILAPLPDTPAERAGIRPGDVILGIDGESALELSLMEAVGKIRGRKGTVVELLVLHLNETEPVLIPVTRGVIPLTSISVVMLDGGIAHVRLSSFNGSTNDELEKVLEQFEKDNGVGLVLDLRNNPGGLVSSVVDVSSQFLDDGLVLYQIDAQGKRTDWTVKSGGKARDIPLVVLVNEFSASASEVLSGALRDHGRAEIVGSTTFGKGSVNNLWKLNDGSGINFTIARWYTPNGDQIEGKGIVPDFEQDNPVDGDADDQLDRAIEVLEQSLTPVASGG